MEKILLFLFVFLSSVLVVITPSDYKENVSKYYDKYIIYEANKANYDFLVVEGICNDELCFGVFLLQEGDKYYVRVFVDEVEYKLRSKNNTEVYAVMRNEEDIKVCVIDSDGDTFSEEYLLKYKDKESLLADANVIEGNNLGIEYSSLKKVFKAGDPLVLIISLSILVSVVCLIIIIILFVSKKGLFGQADGVDRAISKLNDDSFSLDDEELHMPEDDDIQTFEEYQDSLRPWIIKKEQPKKTEEDIKEESVEQEVYTKDPHYYDVDENKYDIKPLLKEKGYDKDYDLMSESEKNDVMLYLMFLLHEGKINDDCYHEEVIKLWKK